MRRYIWELPDWPKWRYEAQSLLDPLAIAKAKQGRLGGILAAAGFEDRRRAQLAALSDDAIETSDIEGERLDPASVRSSVARRLGIREGTVLPKDAKVEGVVELTLDATRNYNEPLSVARLFDWHSLLFPAQLGKEVRIRRVATWREDAGGPMQVVSGAIGREIIHYQAPPADRVPSEMARFLAWFENSPWHGGLVRAAIAHLWFLTIHPFEDGNGRIARAIADMALSQEEDSPDRFFSMTREISVEKQGYYDILEQTQSGSLEITPWLAWFLRCYANAVDAAVHTIDDVLFATRFWAKYTPLGISERQRKVLSKFFNQFEGKLTVRKWAKLANTSHDTANRDISDLIGKGALVRSSGGGRNTSFEIGPV